MKYCFSLRGRVNPQEIMGYVTFTNAIKMPIESAANIVEEAWEEYSDFTDFESVKGVNDFVEWYNTSFPPLYGIMTEVEIYNI